MPAPLAPLAVVTQRPHGSICRGGFSETGLTISYAAGFTFLVFVCFPLSFSFKNHFIFFCGERGQQRSRRPWSPETQPPAEAVLGTHRRAGAVPGAHRWAQQEGEPDCRAASLQQQLSCPATRVSPVVLVTLSHRSFDFPH